MSDMAVEPGRNGVEKTRPRQQQDPGSAHARKLGEDAVGVVFAGDQPDRYSPPPGLLAFTNVLHEIWLRIFSFTGGTRSLQEERDFKARYFGMGVQMLGTAGALAGVVFGSFWILDHFTVGMPLWGGVQTIRIVIVLLMLTIYAVAVHFRERAVALYPFIAHLAFVLGLTATIVVAQQARIGTSSANIYWAMSSSLMTAVVVCFGTSSLTAVNTLLLSAGASIAGVLVCMQVDAPASYIGRLALGLAMTNLVCFSLRLSIQKREVKIFFDRKERDQTLAYTRQLEEARQFAEAARREADQLRATAEAANEAKAAFLANMSHEIRAPVSGIVEVMRMAAPQASPETKRLLEAGEESAGALLSVINGILNYTAGAYLRMEDDAEAVDLESVATTIRALHSAASQSKRVELHVVGDIMDEARYVKVNRMRLMEVANNLVANALKYTDHGSVSVHLQATPSPEDFSAGHFELVVKDTGAGIGKDDLRKVFTPFWQGSRPGRRRSGTGLGLSRVKQIVDGLKGTIDVESVEGLGTKIVVRIPLPLLSYTARAQQCPTPPVL